MIVTHAAVPQTSLYGLLRIFAMAAWMRFDLRLRLIAPLTDPRVIFSFLAMLTWLIPCLTSSARISFTSIFFKPTFQTCMHTREFPL